MRVRRAMTVGFAGLAGFVGAASVAWGCASVTSPYLDALQPNSEAVPAMVVVKGGNWVGGQNLDLLWVPTGQRIGSVTPSGNGDFSTRVEIPASAEKGSDYVDYVRAVQGSKTANTPFGVDSPAEEGAPSVPKVEPVTSMSTSGGTGGTKAPAETGTDPAQPSSQPQTAGSGGIPARPADSSVDSGATSANGSVSAAPAPSAAAAPSAASRVREGSTATATGGPSASPFSPAAAASAEPATAAAEAAVARGSLGDLWTGVEGSPATPGGSLLNLPADAEGTSPVTAVGGVLAISLVALFAGFGMAEARRRRVPAEVEG